MSEFKCFFCSDPMPPGSLFKYKRMGGKQRICCEKCQTGICAPLRPKVESKLIPLIDSPRPA